MSAFQESLGEQIAAVSRPVETAHLPVELWAMDESRFGLHTVRRRRITLRGIKPIGRYQHDFENFYIYGVVAPRTGDGYFQARLAFNTPQFQAFLDDFAAARPDTFNILIVDNARAHHASTLTLPANLALLFQPAYAPELNPCERVWLALKDGLAWRCFDDLLALQDRLAERILAFDPTSFQSLIAYPYLTRALHALPS